MFTHTFLGEDFCMYSDTHFSVMSLKDARNADGFSCFYGETEFPLLFFSSRGFFPPEFPNFS